MLRFLCFVYNVSRTFPAAGGSVIAAFLDPPPIACFCPWSWWTSAVRTRLTCRSRSLRTAQHYTRPPFAWIV